MKKLPNFVKWLIIAVVLAAMAAMMVAVNDRADTNLAAFAEAGSNGPGAVPRPGWVHALTASQAAELLARARCRCRP